MRSRVTGRAKWPCGLDGWQGRNCQGWATHFMASVFAAWWISTAEARWDSSGQIGDADLLRRLSVALAIKRGKKLATSGRLMRA